MKKNLLYLLISTCTLFFSCSHQSTNIIEEEFFTISNVDFPPEEIDARKSVNGCSDTWLQAFYGGGSMENANRNFMRCLRDIPGAGNITGIGNGPTYIEHIREHGDPEPVFQQFLRPGNLQDLIVYAGVTEATTTQDSINKFMQTFSKCNEAIKRIALQPLTVNGTAQTWFSAALSDFSTFYVNIEGVAYPSVGYKYLISFNAGTLKIPPHWQEYGFDFIAQLDVILTLPPVLL